MTRRFSSKASPTAYGVRLILIILTLTILTLTSFSKAFPLLRTNNDDDFQLVPQLPFPSLMSVLRQPLQPTLKEPIDPSNAKTIPGVVTASVLRSALDSLSDLAGLRHILNLGLKGRAIEVFTASDALSSTVANVAHRAALLQSAITQKALTNLTPQQKSQNSQMSQNSQVKSL